MRKYAVRLLYILAYIYNLRNDVDLENVSSSTFNRSTAHLMVKLSTFLLIYCSYMRPLPFVYVAKNCIIAGRVVLVAIR